MLRLRQSKIFISFLVAIILVFSFQQNRPKAVVPFLAAVGVGMAAEALVTMGVKAGSKAILKNKAKSYSADLTSKGKFDWEDLNPYRNKDGSITLSPTANDRAKMAGLVSGALLGSMVERELSDGSTGLSCPPPLDGESYDIPIRDFQPILYDSQINAAGRVSSTYRMYGTGSDTDYTIYIESVRTGMVISTLTGNFGIEDIFWEISGVSASTGDASGTLNKISDGTVIRSSFKVGLGSGSTSYMGEIPDNAHLIACDDLIIPSTVQNIYNAPMNMENNYIMPNNSVLENHSFTINNVYPPSEEEGEVTWGDVETYINDNGLDMAQIMDSNIDTYLENGDIVNNTYTIEEINNIYTDIDQEEKVEDFNPPLEEVLPEPVDPDGDNLPVISPVDRSMLEVVTESYNYLTDSVTNSLEAMRNVTDGATGLVNYLDTSFRWLPAEWRALFGAAFVLGVFAHFFRR